jgi:hypothetical protein
MTKEIKKKPRRPTDKVQSPHAVFAPAGRLVPIALDIHYLGNIMQKFMGIEVWVGHYDGLDGILEPASLKRH